MMRIYFASFVLLAYGFLPNIIAIKVDCDKPESINEEHIHYCCKHPDGHNDIMEQCAKATGFKLPNPNEEAIIDITAERAIAGTCFGKCVFGKFKFMEGEKVDMNAVQQHYNSQYVDDQEYAKEMISAFDHCHGKSEDLTSRFLSSPLFRSMSKAFCEPKSSVVWACVIRQFFHNCPADRWSKTSECVATLEFSKKCHDALTTL